MAKRKTTEELGGEKVVRRSMRVKTEKVDGEVEARELDAEVKPKPVKAKKAGVKKGSPIKDEETEGDRKEEKTTNPPPAETNKADVKGEGERQYWLMKAEPESRLEKGHDVKFSIDDLAAKTEPEPWDGIRSYAARNNLRAMKKGDLAFFYHSSCKIPAIVGIMEVVQEHSPDLTAQDPTAAYYDPKDTDPSSPKWSVVHVVFKEKFENPLTLHELKDMAGRKELQGLQLLKQSRLSVSKVGSGEWEFLMGVIGGREAGGKVE